jgi:hypothetical protein
LTTNLPLIAFPKDILVKFHFIEEKNTDDCNASHNLTISGLGFGICIPIQSVPGTGETIRRAFALSDSAISFFRFSIAETLIPASGLILICTIDGQISNQSIDTGTLNSRSLSCNHFACCNKNLLFS